MSRSSSWNDPPVRWIDRMTMVCTLVGFLPVAYAWFGIAIIRLDEGEWVFSGLEWILLALFPLLTTVGLFVSFRHRMTGAAIALISICAAVSLQLAAVRQMHFFATIAQVTIVPVIVLMAVAWRSMTTARGGRP